MEQQVTNFERIALAIRYIREHFRQQPSLEEVAEKVHLSPFHFQRLFTEWAGVSPKQFLQYITAQHAKNLLAEPGATLFDAAFETGLSGTGRLHDLFIKLEGMTPGEYKNGGENLQISYSFAETPFGQVLVASTARGICYLAFAEQQAAGLAELKAMFPRARFTEQSEPMQERAIRFFSGGGNTPGGIKLHLKGTPFQLKVWESLLKIPSGRLSSYGKIAAQLDQPKASRAVGSAVGDNPVAYLIPCHRVIHPNGEFGQYHWGPDRKAAMIGWESARQQNQDFIVREI